MQKWNLASILAVLFVSISVQAQGLDKSKDSVQIQLPSSGQSKSLKDIHYADLQNVFLPVAVAPALAELPQGESIFLGRCYGFLDFPKHQSALLKMVVNASGVQFGVKIDEDYEFDTLGKGKAARMLNSTFKNFSETAQAEGNFWVTQSRDNQDSNEILEVEEWRLGSVGSYYVVGSSALYSVDSEQESSADQKVQFYRFGLGYDSGQSIQNCLFYQKIEN